MNKTASGKEGASWTPARSGAGGTAVEACAGAGTAAFRQDSGNIIVECGLHGGIASGHFRLDPVAIDVVKNDSGHAVPVPDNCAPNGRKTW